LYHDDRWTRLVLPGKAAIDDAVSCPKVGTCVVMASVGTYDPVLKSNEYVSGRWRALHVRVGRLAGVASVASLSCVTATDCAAVGHYGFGGPAGSGVVLDLRGTTWQVAEVQSAAQYRGGFFNVSCARTGTCVATEDLSWPLSHDADGLAGFLAQGRVEGRWTSLGRGLPGPDQLIVAQAGVQCLAAGVCVVTAASDTAMFTGTVVDGRLSPLRVVRGIRLHGTYPWLSTLSCASPTFCVQASDSFGAPYVLVGSATP
jgi:hypothetical protein